MIIARVLEHARSHPDDTALVELSSGHRTTYGGLARHVHRLASAIEGAGWAGRTVLVALGASSALVAAEVAVRAAGAVPVVIGGDLTPARVADLVQASGCAAVVTASADGLPQDVGRVVVPARLSDWSESFPLDTPGGGVEPGTGGPGPETCYGVFTSGSTGTPKLVLVGERALMNLLDWYTGEYALRRGTVTALMVRPAFDVHVMETWAALTAGATALVVDRADVRVDPLALTSALRAHAVEVVFVPTPLARGLCDALLDSPVPHALRHLHVGGDRLDFWPSVPGVAVHNQYGPAECAVVSTAVDVATVRSPHEGPPPIGYPVPGATCVVVDEAGQPVDPGVPGELWIGGAGVAEGYAWRPDLTAERFLTVDGVRHYRTGDVVWAEPDGLLHFIGRVDNQVKVRGNRVEPGEVEAAARRYPGVFEAAVVPDASSGEVRLVGFVVGDVEPREVREHLAGVLPEYMVPAVVSILPRLPMTGNDKVDRAELARRAAGTATVDERTDQLVGVEGRLARIWEQVLGVPVRPEDDFFDLGGHSLAAMRVVTLAEEEGLEVGLRALLTGMTLSEVAETCTASSLEVGP
ncbi:non-ribosomal peptide synthetase [uncultured Cellulomonas sp.]|uniref:non-ribosomal peptide synthetase n=1 Tax=uncultured Cellulomonas sp. TaxID=189682 RepID=UPI0028EFE012|nr:non-ribosomal peptide synthetase [uncultured Cellulomonas sp.]